MGAYNQGGGGGRAVDVTENDQFAFDQPFEIGSAFTAETANQINDMFRILFKSQRRAEDKTIALTSEISGITSGELLTVTRALTEAEIESLGSTPITLVDAAGADKTIHPICALLEVTVTVGYSTSPTASLIHQGSGTDLIAFNAFSFVTTDGHSSFGMGLDHVRNPYGTFDPRNKALQIELSANPGTPGTGVATGTVTVYYVIVTTT